MPQTNNEQHSVAAKLKQLRQEKGWSLSVCAEKTGISKAMLGQIERQESSPTLATLWKLATGFDISLSWLVLDDQATTDKSPQPVHYNKDGIKVQNLLRFDPVSRQEVYLLTMAPGSESMSDAHREGTTETLYVVSGELEVWLNDNWQRFKQGEAFRFNAAQRHGYRNASQTETVFHDVISYL